MHSLILSLVFLGGLISNLYADEPIRLVNVIEKNMDVSLEGRADGRKVKLLITRSGLGHNVSVEFEDDDLKQYNRSKYFYFHDSGSMGQPILLWGTNRSFTLPFQGSADEIQIRFNQEMKITSFKFFAKGTEGRLSISCRRLTRAISS